MANQADILNYNSQLVENVNWNGSPVDVLRIVVGDVDAEWRKEEVEFGAYIYGVGAETGKNFTIDSATLKQDVGYESGQFVLHFKGLGYDEIGMTTSSGHFHNSNAFISLFDNKLAVLNNSVQTKTYRIYPNKKPQNVKMCSVGAQVDENQSCLVSLGCITKVIRVPSSGYSFGKARFYTLPYTFDSNLFIDEPAFILLTRGASSLNYIDLTELEGYTDNGITLSTIKDGALDYTLNYDIAENSTTNYNEWSVFFTYKEALYNQFKDGTVDLSYGTTLNTSFGTDLSCMIHFIQEPYAKNRIYYGVGFKLPSFDDMYNETSSNEYSEHYFFETTNSRILKEDSYELIVQNQNKIAYPLDFEYDLDLSQATNIHTISENYMWGNRVYKVIRVLGSNSFTVTFNKK